MSEKKGIFTRGQIKVLDFFSTYYSKFLYYPTYKEAGKHLKMSAVGVFQHVKSLQKLGALEEIEKYKYHKKQKEQMIEYKLDMILNILKKMNK